MSLELIFSIISASFLLGVGLLMYAHKNFITKEEFKNHRTDMNKRDNDLKEWLIRIEAKIDYWFSKVDK